MSDIDKPKGESEKDAEKETEVVFQQYFMEELEKVMAADDNPNEVNVKLRLPEEIFNKVYRHIAQSRYIYKVLGVEENRVSWEVSEKLIIIDLSREEAMKVLTGKKKVIT